MASPNESRQVTPKDPNTRHRRRRTLSGLGSTTSVEKNVYGRFLDDTFSGIGEITIGSLPALWWVLLLAPNQYFGVKNATIIAVAVMVLAVALFRGRLLSPPGTDADGWVSLTPSLILFRVLYYNVALIVTGYTAGFVGTDVGSPIGSAVIAIGLAAGAIAAFPWTTEQFENWLAEWDPQL